MVVGKMGYLKGLFVDCVGLLNLGVFYVGVIKPDVNCSVNLKLWVRFGKFFDHWKDVFRKPFPTKTQITNTLKSFKVQTIRALRHVAFSVVTGFHLVVYWTPSYLYKTVFVKFIITSLKVKESHGLSDKLDPPSTVFADDYFASRSKITGSIATAVLQLNGHVTKEYVQYFLDRNFFPSTNPESSSPVLDKLISYPEHWLGYWFWKNDVTFSVVNHVHELKYFGKNWNTKTLGKLHQKLMNGEFPEMRSPWNVTLVQRIADNVMVTVVILKFHQCLGDPKEIISYILGPSETETFGHVTNNLPKKINLLSKFNIFPTNVRFLKHQQEIQCHPWCIQGKSEDTCQNFVRFSENISMDYIRSAAINHGNVSTSAVLINAVMEAVRNFLPEEDHNDQQWSSAPFLVNILNRSGNYCGIIEPDLTQEAESYDSTRMKRLHDTINGISSMEIENMVTLNSTLIRPLRFARKLPLLKAFLTSVTIFEEDDDEKEETVYFGGKRVSDFSLSGARVLPSITSSVGVTFNAFCYQGSVRFCIVAKSTLLSECQCEKIVKLLENEILKSWAWSTLALHI